MNEYVPAFVNVHDPDQVPDVGAFGKRTGLGEAPPTACWQATPVKPCTSKSTLWSSTDMFEKVTMPPVTMLALVAEPLPAVRWNWLTPSTVLKAAVEGGSSPCAIVAVTPPAAASPTTSSATRNLDCMIP